MKRIIVVGVALMAFVAIVVSLSSRGVEKTVAAQGTQMPASELPTFQVDPSWPKKLPNNWVMGSVSGVNVDAQDHVWVITRPREIVKPEDKGRTPAPPVLEFDGAGNFIQGWGGPEKATNGPTRTRRYQDSKGYVWIAGRGKDDDQILKFTNTGKFVMQIGHSAQSKGNTDTANLNLPADVTVYPKTNEVFVADGYGNRRIIVFDADTGKYKRCGAPSATRQPIPKNG